MRRFVLPLILLLAALTACGQALSASVEGNEANTGFPLSRVALFDPPAAPTAVNAIVDSASFAAALRAAGASVEPEGEVSQDFLAGEGTLLRVDDQHMQVYEYPDTAAARADAARFSSDGAWVSGDIGATLVNWFATPHLFQSASLIAVYVGDHRPTLDLLETVLGEPFAGGANPYRTAMLPSEN